MAHSTDLTQYSNKEMSLMMREAIGRMGTSNALSEGAMEKLYHEYRTRSNDRVDNPEKPHRVYEGAERKNGWDQLPRPVQALCDACGSPLDDHQLKSPSGAWTSPRCVEPGTIAKGIRV